MTFPQTPLDVQTELQLAGVWTDITEDVYLRDPMTITRGRADESSRCDASTCTLTLNNRSGTYSPRNPLSPLYGLIGRNTPVRVSVRTGAPYLSLDGASANYATTPDNAALDITGDLDLRVEASGDWFDLTRTQTLIGRWANADADALWVLYVENGNLWLNWQANAGFWTTDFTIPDEVPQRAAFRATVDVNNGAGGATATLYWAESITGPWTQISAFTATGTQTLATGSIDLRVAPTDTVSAPDRLPLVGRVHKAEVRSGIGGTLVASPDFTAQTPGATSFTDAAGRPWTVAGTAELTNRQVRFAGEISSWPTRWDVSGKDVYVSAQAAGILRRLGQGASPLDSTLKRRIPSDPNLLAYWPMEEGDGATQAYSPITGVPPMRAIGMQWGADDSLAGSLALPAVQAPCSISGSVPTAVASTQWRVEFVYRIDTAPTTASTLINFTSTGTVKKWTIRYQAGDVDLIGTDTDGNLIVNSSITVGTNIFNAWTRQIFTLTQSGGTVTWTIRWTLIGELDGGALSSTYSGTTGACTGVNSVFSTGTVGARIGHIAVFKVASTSIFDSADTGFDGDTAASRISRLCTEEGVPYGTPNGRAGTAPMGPQHPDTVLNLIGDAEDADQGILYEPRDTISLAYRPRTSLYNQPVSLALDYSADGEVAPPLEPTEDDTATRNDITVSRPSGSSARATLDTGALSTLAPPAGVGRYTTSEAVNVQTDDQLGDIAGWLLHLGTWDAPRYPAVSVDLAAAPWLIDQATDLDVGDRVQIANPPPWLPPGTIDLLAQGYTETIGEYDWDITYNCTAGGPWVVGVIEDPEVPARLDTDGSQLSAGVTASATSVSVATTSGPVWTTDPAETPWDIRVGGEVMTVTAVGTQLAPNSLFTTDVSGWLASGCTFARDTATVFPGAVASGKVTPDGATAAGGITQTPRTAVGTITPAATYLAVGWVYSPGGWSDLRAAVDWYDASNTFLSSGLGSATVVAAGSWTFLTQTLTAPASSSRAAVRIRHGGTPASTAVYYTWAVRLIPTASVSAASPQAMTVVRSVNGISKAQLAGADVRLADPTYIAL